MACTEEIRKKQNSIAISYFCLQRKYLGFFSWGIESYFAVFVLNLENEMASFPVKDPFCILCSSSAIVVDTAVLYLNFVS